MTQAWYLSSACTIHKSAMEQASAHQSILTKPAGSLGLLEDLAIQFAGWQGQKYPQCSAIRVRVFAGDHGVCDQGVSAFPQQVTAQMVQNFIHGGAAISILSKRVNADFAVVNMGTVAPLDDAQGLVNLQLMKGTADFTKQSAMSAKVMHQALDTGKDQIAVGPEHLFVGGEMGIGNTTAASAIYSSVLSLAPQDTVGPGTGVDANGLQTKCRVIQQALDLHGDFLDSPLAILQRLGGLEIAALVGAYIGAAQNGTPSLIDGFICTAAALLAVEINPSVRQWMIFAHRSAEPAHTQALEHLNAKPILDLGLRLGEGSGAAVAVPLLQSALALHNEMATFSDAGVSGQN